MQKKILAISSPSQLNKLRDALNRAKPNSQRRRKQKFIFRNTSRLTYKAGQWYSLPLVFDIPRGYYNGSGLFQTAELLNSKQYMTLATNAGTWAGVNTPFDAVVASLIANEPVCLRSLFDFQDQATLDASRLYPPQIVDFGATTISFANRATAAGSIAGAFRFDVDVLPDDSAEIEFNTEVNIGVYFDAPNVSQGGTTGGLYPYYIDNVGRVGIYRRTASNAINEEVYIVRLDNDEQTSETTTARNVPARRLPFKVIATVENPNYTEGTSRDKDWRDVLTRYYNPLTKIESVDYNTFTTDKVLKEKYCLPCLFVADPYQPPNKLKQQYYFYTTGVSSGFIGGDRPIKDSGQYAKIEDVKKPVYNGLYVFTGGEILPEMIEEKSAAGVRYPYARIVSQDEQQEGLGW